MVYLAIQTFLLLATTALAFFGLGYYFHKRFSKARIVVSEKPPSDPRPVRQGDDPEKVIRDLRTRLLEKERDFAELLQNPPVKASERNFNSVETTEFIQDRRKLEDRFLELQASLEKMHMRNRELEEENRSLEAKCAEWETAAQTTQKPPEMAVLVQNEAAPFQWESLQAEVSLKNSRIEELQLALDASYSDLGLRDNEIASLTQQLEEKQSELARLTESMPLEMPAPLEEVEALRKRVATLETQLYEREYLLQVSRQNEQKDQEDIARTVDAIWEDEDLSQAIAPAESKPKLTLAPDVDRKLEVLQSRNERIERELRTKMLQLESTMESLRNESEKALATALSMQQVAPVAPSVATPVEEPHPLWTPPIATESGDRDRIVELLWKEEKDAEKLRLNRSVEMLTQALNEKERALVELGGKVAELSHKVDPNLLGPDNLELIKGIGPATRKLLEKEFGIRSFEQVARLSKKEIAEISKHLFFAGKIEKEDWLGQAEELYEKKHGKKLGEKNRLAA